MTAKAASSLIAGTQLPSLISAISSASCQYILATGTVTSTNIALGPGAGTQTGTIVGLVPTGMTALMLSRAALLGMAGKDITRLFESVSFGVVTGMSTVILQGVLIGAGPGTGTGKIMGLVPTGLQALILSQSLFRLISGTQIASLVSCIAFGICTHIMSFGTVLVTNIGVAAGPPAGPVLLPAVPGIGRLV